MSCDCFLCHIVIDNKNPDHLYIALCSSHVPLSQNDIIITLFREHLLIATGVMSVTLLMETECSLVSWPYRSLQVGFLHLLNEVHTENNQQIILFPGWRLA